MRVTHVQYFSRPVPFKTRKPCAYRSETTHANREVTGNVANEVARLLGDALVAGNAGPCLPSRCRADTLPAGPDLLTLRFPAPRDTISIRFSPELGSVTYEDGSGHSYCVMLGPQVDTLVADLLRAMPSDSRLRELPGCREVGTPPGTRSASWSSSDSVWVEELPSVRKKVSLRYPADSDLEGLETVISVRALIGTDGQVIRTALDPRPANLLPFIEEAVRAVERWEFTPARSGGRAISVWVVCPIRFRP